ncbi:serine racemase VanT catalytic subunit [Hominifimenecus sp. rT4P-3]|uniref:serine racemase VanT catalytic subunit n=1 Tax=Hominifimenecus sp. rT4P-3 TaxID=3242979 RepID=UPI003DA21072
MYEKGRAWIELNLDSLKSNLSQLQAILPSSCALMPAVKANAYGHGAIPIARTLSQQNITHFCVASAEEGIQLREAGIPGEILVLGYTHPEQFEELYHYHLTQTVVDASYGLEISRFGKELSVHVGIDTGMRRLGERSENLDRILSIWNLPHLKITGLFSHLCVPDSPKEADILFTHRQIQRFQTVARCIRGKSNRPFACHLQGSYGILNYPHLSFDYARPGLALYGALSQPDDHTLAPFSPRPVLSLKARVESLKSLHAGESAGYGLAYTAKQETTLAVVSIGYADGIPRELSGKGSALIRGKTAPIVGRICMDQLLLDVSLIPKAVPGDEAVFIGTSGGKAITAAQVAEKAGTISNEILSRLGSRLPRTITCHNCPNA